MIQPDDIVFNLGDVTFSDPKGENFRQFSNYPGQQILINGNHWSGQKQLYEEQANAILAPQNGFVQRIYPVNVGNITFVGDVFETFIDSDAVFMQHRAPYIWPEIGKGGFALCGHSHGRCVELNPTDDKQGRILDVGVDNAIAYNGTPFFSWDDVKRIMDKKPIIARDHH